MDIINNNVFRGVIYLTLLGLGSTVRGSVKLTNVELTNVERFRESNPVISKELEELKRDPSRLIRERGKLIGEGGVAQVYICKAKVNGSEREFVVKLPIGEYLKRRNQAMIDKESAVGQALIEAFEQMKDDPLFSDYQGLPVIAMPIRLPDGIQVQEKINGPNGFKAIEGKLPPFTNGYVDDPRKAIERVLRLVFGLHALHQAGKVHGDLKLDNIIFEERLPEEIRIWIIDLGLTQNIGGPFQWMYSSNGAPEYISPSQGQRQELEVYPSYDIYTLGTMLPGLFFGNGTKGVFDDKVIGDGFDMRGQGGPSKFVQFYRAKEDKLIRKYQMEENELTRQRLVQDELQNKIRTNMLEAFKEMNNKMLVATEKAYSEEELKVLAQVTADCLSLDPIRRPSAQEIIESLTGLLTNAYSNGYKLEDLTVGERRSLGLTKEEIEAPDLTPEQLQEFRKAREAREKAYKAQAQRANER
jgi:serine/threonine protein kinase